MTSLNYSQYLQFRQNPTCIIDGPTGPTGANGPTGAQGPQGIPGANGISTGLIYYFTQTGNVLGPTGAFSPGGMSVVPGANPGPNPLYTNTYNGWFFEQTATGTMVQIARFTSPPINQSIIPRGNWAFYNNIYSFTGPTRPADPTGAVPNTVYVKAYLANSATGPPGPTIIDTSVSNRGVPITGLDDTTVIITQEIPNDIVVPNPSTDYIVVEYKVQSIAPGGVTEFWTQGDSVGYVVTSLATQGGATGATGPTGDPGLPGAQGIQGIQGPPGVNASGRTAGALWYSKNGNIYGFPILESKDPAFTNFSFVSPFSGSPTGLYPDYFIGVTQPPDSTFSWQSPELGGPATVYTNTSTISPLYTDMGVSGSGQITILYRLY